MDGWRVGSAWTDPQLLCSVFGQGPHEFTAALQVYQRVQAEFPNAKIRASDAFDDFVAKVLPVQHTLPVLTHEMGDSWICEQQWLSCQLS